MHRDPALTVRGLAIEVAGARAVDGVSLELEPGKLLALVGESGSGKSLTALACVRLLPRAARVVAGEIRCRGRSVLDLDAAALRALRGKEIGFVFQEPMTALHPTIRVGEQVAEAILVHERVAPREARARATALLERVGIPEPARRYGAYAHELSGGQRQRVGIAMALAAGPSVLIADEPTTALDASVRKGILDLIGDLRRERGLAVLLVTHDLGVVAAAADEVAVLYAGRIVERAPAAVALEGPLHPYTRGLLRSIPRLDGARRARLDAIPGAIPPPRARPSGCRFRDRCAEAIADCATADPPLAAKRPDHAVACIRA
ncbi:MAG TPA: ABC transporter ATP-binding protein [Planctomycetota bacterium]|nr:ABC transporter ATP-binding protein [Planctomycetota bacterium]